MTQSLFVYWHRLRHRPADEAEHPAAPVLDLAGCFRPMRKFYVLSSFNGSPRPETIVARLGEAAPAPREPR